MSSLSRSQASEPMARMAEGGPAFLGSVYYVADPSTSSAVEGFPPALTRRGPRKAKDEEANAGGAFFSWVGRRVGFGFGRKHGAPGGAGSERGGRGGAEYDDDGESADGGSAGDVRVGSISGGGEEGPRSYFTTREGAERWADRMRRPRGLWQFHRRRLWRPSDVPLGAVEVRATPMGEAYERLCAGWGNPVLAAKMGFCADHLQKTLAAELVDGWGEPDADGDGGAAEPPARSKIEDGGGGETSDGRAGAAGRRIVCSGMADALLPLLTGYHATAGGGAWSRGADAWIEREIRAFVSRHRKKDLLEDGADGAPVHTTFRVSVPGSFAGGAVATWRRVAKQLSAGAAPPAVESVADSGRLAASGEEEPDVSPTGGSATWGGSPRFRRLEDVEGRGEEEEEAAAEGAPPRRMSDAEFDLLLTAYAQSAQGWDDPAYPVDRPVFSSPLVQAMIPSAGAEQLQVNAQTATETASSSPDASSDASLTTPTHLTLYRPWFFNLSDLTDTLHKAMEAEARIRSARNRARREKLVRTLAQMVTALGNTRGNPRLGGWSFPGSSSDGGTKTEGGGAAGLGGGGPGATDDAADDDCCGDDDDEGDDLLDDDSGLSDDGLMKEYMREMMRDGTAEEMLGAWAAAAVAARGGRGRGGVPDKDKKQLNLSPASHFGLVGLVTLYFGWSVLAAAVGGAWDSALCSTSLGRVVMTLDTPYADALNSIEVGSFDGICAAAVASSAAHDVGRRAVASHESRQARLDEIASQLDETAVAIERTVEAVRGKAEAATKARAELDRYTAAVAALDEAEAKAKGGGVVAARGARKAARSRAAAEKRRAASAAEAAAVDEALARLNDRLKTLEAKRARHHDEMRVMMEQAVADSVEMSRFMEGLRAALATSDTRVGQEHAKAAGAVVSAPLLTHPPLFISDVGGMNDLTSAADLGVATVGGDGTLRV